MKAPFRYALVAAALSVIAAPATAQSERCVIASVHDSDSVRCRDGRRIRLVGVDAPELSARPYGPQARAATLRMLPIGSVARLAFDVVPTDQYGRTLAYVWSASGQFVNLELARQGYAMQLTIPPNVRFAAAISGAVAEARRARRGLWATGGFDCAPSDYRRGRCGPTGR